MIDTPTRVEFLKKLHLFRGLSDDELNLVAGELQEKTFDQGSTVFVEGAAADSLYIIYQGRVDITRHAKDKVIKVASLVRGDYFGEQGLLKDKTRNASVVAAERDTILLILFREPFNRLLAKASGLRQNFDIMMASRKLANELRFKWLAENEIIYFMTRKHTFLLIRALTIPALLLVPIFAVIGFAFRVTLPGISLTIGAVGGFLLVADLAWALWRWVDWGNDYYIVTNQRVIWLEKVVGLYDSRTEAGVATILSVSSETDYWGRMWDYGTVVVRTFTGQIRLDFVRHPKQAAAMIEEYWNRAKEGSRKANEDVMRKAIRLKMGVDKPPPQPVQTVPAKPPKKKSAFEIWRQNAFRMRIEDGNIVTYHKHIFVLYRNTAPYTISVIFLILFMLTWPLWFSFTLPTWLAMLFLLAMFVLFCFAVYEYMDWENDIYQVTPDQIVDVTRKPFGTEDRKAAPLENILSTEYKRTGILGMLLNYGSVMIMVGGAQFRFEDVADPPSVQQDIVRRQQGRMAKKREVEGAAERDRMADWLAVYNRTLEEINREKNQPGPNPE